MTTKQTSHLSQSSRTVPNTIPHLKSEILLFLVLRGSMEARQVPD